jgi:hypothetical protein
MRPLEQNSLGCLVERQKGKGRWIVALRREKLRTSRSLEHSPIFLVSLTTGLSYQDSITSL